MIFSLRYGKLFLFFHGVCLLLAVRPGANAQESAALLQEPYTVKAGRNYTNKDLRRGEEKEFSARYKLISYLDTPLEVPVYIRLLDTHSGIEVEILDGEKNVVLPAGEPGRDTEYWFNYRIKGMEKVFFPKRVAFTVEIVSGEQKVTETIGINLIPPRFRWLGIALVLGSAAVLSMAVIFVKLSKDEKYA